MRFGGIRRGRDEAEARRWWPQSEKQSRGDAAVAAPARRLRTRRVNVISDLELLWDVFSFSRINGFNSACRPCTSLLLRLGATYQELRRSSTWPFSQGPTRSRHLHPLTSNSGLSIDTQPRCAF